MRRATTVIGIAGGIGSGKSAFARALGRLGARVFDADVSAKSVLDHGDVKAALIHKWGARVLGADGRIDRQAVASIVFADHQARAYLESLIHPRVRAEAVEAIAVARAEGVRAVVLDVPLLFESGMDAMCDVVIFVDAAPEVRAARVASTRGWNPGELARREAAQWPLDKKRRHSGIVVINNGSEQTDLDAEASRAYSAACPGTGV